MSSQRVPYPLSKRLVDKVVSGLLLVLLSPVLVVVVAVMGADMVVARADRGSFLYREKRVSRGREFDLLKFRTLRRSALKLQAGEEAHARLLEADPANLTWAGRRVLKPWYLDELPQLLNVLKGDMSLVGPRPWPPSLVRLQVSKGLDYRNLITAGWTGPAQVQKDITDPERYSVHDLAYVEACSTLSWRRLLLYDLGILSQTIGLLLRGEGLRY